MTERQQAVAQRERSVHVRQSRVDANLLHVSPAAISQIQEQLACLGYNPGRVDGVWGPNTVRALKSFQEVEGFEPTGRLDIETIGALGGPNILMSQIQQGNCEQYERMTSAHPGVPLYAGPVTIGEVQAALRDRGFFSGDINGRWDRKTKEATRRFQSSADIAATGELDLGTLAALDIDLREISDHAQARAGSPDYITVGVREEGTPIRLDTAEVREVQRMLNETGYNSGRADGRIGLKTETALRRYQRANCLEPTGNLNAETIESLGLGDMLASLGPVSGPMMAGNTQRFENMRETESRYYGYQSPNYQGRYQSYPCPNYQNWDRGYQSSNYPRWNNQYNQGWRGQYNQGWNRSYYYQPPQNYEQSYGAVLYASPADVMLVQRRLNSAGFNAGAEDGVLGEQTRVALADFQRSQGIEPTGSLTLETLSEMGLAGILHGAVPDPGAWARERLAAEASWAGAPICVDNETMRDASERLNELGFNNTGEPGSFSAALASYQQSQDLPATGTIDMPTLSALDVMPIMSASGSWGPAPLRPGVFEQDMKRDMSGDIDQQREMRSRYDENDLSDIFYMPGYPAQEYGSSNRAESNRFWRENPALSSEYNGGCTPMHVSPMGVSQIQNALASVGYEPDNYTGEWTPGTSTAVREFQRNRDLEPTGKLNMRTVRSLGFGDTFADISVSGETYPSPEGMPEAYTPYGYTPATPGEYPREYPGENSNERNARQYDYRYHNENSPAYWNALPPHYRQGERYQSRPPMNRRDGGEYQRMQSEQPYQGRMEHRYWGNCQCPWCRSERREWRDDGRGWRWDDNRGWRSGYDNSPLRDREESRRSYDRGRYRAF